MKKLILLTFIFITNSAVADASLPLQTIKRIETGWGSEGIYISTNEGHIVENCTSAKLRINSDHVMLDKVLAIALSAYHAQSKVQFRVSGCTGNEMNLIAIAVHN